MNLKPVDPVYQILFWFFAILAVIYLFFGCSKPLVEEHTCKWVKCPYKAVLTSEWHSKVEQYVGNNESITYSLDMLHLQHPTWEYEQLEEAIVND